MYCICYTNVSVEGLFVEAAATDMNGLFNGSAHLLHFISLRIIHGRVLAYDMWKENGNGGGNVEMTAIYKVLTSVYSVSEL